MLTEVLEEDLVITELKSKKKEDVIKEMAGRFLEVGVVKDGNKFIEALREREKIETTAIGSGVAIPHARSDTVEGLAVVFAKSEEGVDFESVDGKPVQLIFMIACSPDINREYLQTLARIARLCKNYKMKDSLIKAKDKKEIMTLIKGFDAGSGKFEEIRLKRGRTVYPGKTTD
jgi:PTS system fructose-specific IIC component